MAEREDKAIAARCKMSDVNTRIRRRRRRLAVYKRRNVFKRLRSPVTILLICLITGLAGYIGVQGGGSVDLGIAKSVHAEESVVYKNIVIQSGDTIWNIACEYAEPSKDVRKLVNEICKLNDIKAGSIYPGQVIKVPVPAHLDV